MVEHAKEIIFWGVLGGVVIYDSLLFFSIAKPEFRFWPPPPRPSWRHEVMRVTGVVGPLSVVGMLALGVLDWDSFALATLEPLRSGRPLCSLSAEPSLSGVSSAWASLLPKDSGDLCSSAAPIDILAIPST